MKTMICTIIYILNCMNKWYKKWFAVIWATIISCLFIVILFFVTNTCSAKYIDSTCRKSDLTERAELMNAQPSMGKVHRERLDNLFSKWDSILEEDRNELRNTLKTISICLSIWIGIIAAICTILPIVLGINANSNFQKDIDRAKEDMAEKITGLKAKMETSISEKETTFNNKVAEIEKQLQKKVETAETKIQDTAKKQEQKMQELRITLDESLKMSKSSQIAQTLSDLSVHMRVISELQEFDSKDKGTLTKPSLLIRALDNLVYELENIGSKIQPDNKEEQMFVSIVLMLCMLKRLLISVESTFKDYNLLSLQKIRSKIDKTITDLMAVPKGTANNKYLISEACKYSTDIQNLFKDYIEENIDKSERK